MLEVKLLGNVAQKMDSLVTADVSEEAPYDCDAEHGLVDYFDPVPSVKHLWHCGLAGEGFGRTLALGIDLAVLLAGVVPVIKLISNRAKHPAGKDVDKSAEVIFRLEYDLFIRTIRPSASAALNDESNFDKVVGTEGPDVLLIKLARHGRNNEYAFAVRFADLAAKWYEGHGKPLLAGKAKLLGAFYSSKDTQAPRSEALVRFFEAEQLLKKAHSKLNKAAGQYFFETMFEDLNARLMMTDIKFNFMISTLRELFKKTPPQDVRSEYERFKNEGGVEFVLKRWAAEPKVSPPDSIADWFFEPSHYKDWQIAHSGRKPIEIFVEAEARRALAKGWYSNAALSYLGAAYTEGITADQKTDAVLNAAKSFEKAGQYPEALKYYDRATRLVAHSGKPDKSKLSSILFGKGKVLKALGENKKAIEKFELAAKLEDNLAYKGFIMEHAIDCYEKAGDFNGAISAMKIAIEGLYASEQGRLDNTRFDGMSRSVEGSADENSRMQIRLGGFYEKAGQPLEAIECYRNAQATYTVVIDSFDYNYAHPNPALVAEAGAAIERLQAASTAGIGVFKGGSHKATGPKIDPNLILSAARGGEEALEKLMREVRERDPGITRTRLVEILTSIGSENNVAELERLGFDPVKIKVATGFKLAGALKAKAGVDGSRREEDRRGRKGPLGK